MVVISAISEPDRNFIIELSVRQCVAPGWKPVQSDANDSTSIAKPTSKIRACGISLTDLAKAGTGLVDTVEYMRETGGDAKCFVDAGNSSVEVVLRQARQAAPTQTVARRVVPVDVYVTNLLPFKVLPRQIYALPLRDEEIDAPLFAPEEDPRDFPIFVRNTAFLMSFANPALFAEFSDRRGFLKHLETWDVEDLIGTERQYLLFWLLKHHWEVHLKKFPLYVEASRRRAYFRLDKGDSTGITYVSRTGRNTTRTVVKRRGEERRISFENEAILYSVIRFLGEWALQIPKAGLLGLLPVTRSQSNSA